MAVIAQQCLQAFLLATGGSASPYQREIVGFVMYLKMGKEVCSIP